MHGRQMASSVSENRGLESYVLSGDSYRRKKGSGARF